MAGVTRYVDMMRRYHDATLLMLASAQRYAAHKMRATSAMRRDADTL